MATSKKSTPVREWPLLDREAWNGALTVVSLMEPDGLAAAWRPATRRFVVEGYGYWLAWLKRSGYLDPTSPPGDRITPCRLESYLSYLRSHLATATVENRLVSLDRGIYAMAPAADRTLLRRLIRHVHDPNAGVAQKRRRVVDSYDLFGLGIRMMVEAEDPRHDFMRPVLRPVRYRDGLIVSLLAARPLRRRNIAGLLLGEHVRRIDRRWWILVPAEETKNRSALELPFPDNLVDHLERYLEVHRPALLRHCGRISDDYCRAGPLWISSRTGKALSGHTMNLQVGEHTRMAFGRRVNLHLFRHCAATSVAIRDPEHVEIIIAILGHRCYETQERHYNLARSMEAAEDYHRCLDRVIAED